MSYIRTGSISGKVSSYWQWRWPKTNQAQLPQRQSAHLQPVKDFIKQNKIDFMPTKDSKTHLRFTHLLISHQKFKYINKTLTSRVISEKQWDS